MKILSFSRCWLWRAFGSLLLLAALLITTRQAVLQSTAPHDLAAILNQERQAAGIAPLSWSTLLAQAAQRHADDLATHNLIDTTGSDGSTYRQRIRETGYRAWDDGLLVYETLWVGLGNADNAMSWFRSTPQEWENFMDPRFREVGVGYAESKNIHYFVISFGSRPGVLPVFINEGAESATLPQIVIRLTNEEAVPLGEGRWIGEAIEVRLGETPNLEDAPWQPWEDLMPWVLSTNTPGDYAVYVEFRDGAGRTTISQDTIRLTAPGEGDALPTVPRVEPTLPTVDPNDNTNIGVEVTETPTSEPPLSIETPLATETTPAPTPAATPATPAPDIAVTPPEPSATLPPQVLVNERQPADWTLISAILLQGVALLLGAAAFLRRK
ncbi:MAG: Cysteine-rich secretory protein family protein [Chloroflexi bacterium ADurb.Bin360]|nr:MAG: Cysteine-rich secretory protein family protein [Chloroflexi bacterium ADurb.Bin360]